jgi:hypothetical protein
MAIEEKTLCTCDLCGVQIDVTADSHPRDVKRRIPGVPAFEPAPVHLAIVEGGSMSPFDLCPPCWEKAWAGLDPKGALRKRINDQVAQHHARRRR